MNDYRLIGELMANRQKQKISQKTMAEKMGCTQSWISKLESSRDNDINIGEARAYARALELSMVIILEACPHNREE